METKIELPKGWFYDNDIAVYRNIYSLLPVKAITLEIGCWKGRSICSVADIIKEKNITVYVVDTFMGSENEKFTFHAEAQTTDIEKIFKENITLFGIENNIKILKGDSGTIWEKYPIPNQTFDFIFIDGQHTADLVESDIRNSLPKLKNGKILAGHDIVLLPVAKGVEAVFGNNFEVNSNIWKKNKEDKQMEEKKIILISCWSKPCRDGKWNAKNPSKEWWTQIVKLLKGLDYNVWQCGQGPEIKIKGVDRYLWDKNLWALGDDIKLCYTWIAVDNFFPHFAWLQFKKPGVVIWSQSDPEIFGHDGNVNICNRKYLRFKQFELWEAATYNADAFPTTEEVMIEVEKMILKNGKTPK